MDEQRLAAEATYAIEEPVNTWINRPLAAFLVDFFYTRTALTPNQVTLLAIVVGVAAGGLFGAGTLAALFWAALVYQLSCVLDCVDGQLARLTRTSSEFGRILDGVGDYIVNIAVFGGMLWSQLHPAADARPLLSTWLGYDPSWNWLVLTLGFLSGILHAPAYDFVKTKFHSILKTGVDQTVRERRELGDRFARERQTHGAATNLLHAAYLRYTDWQHAAFDYARYRKETYTLAERERILREHRGIFRAWSWVGPNTHLIALPLAALAGDPMLSAAWFLVPMNLHFLWVVIHSKRVLDRA